MTSGRRTLALLAIGAASACNGLLGNGYGREGPSDDGGPLGDGAPTFDATDEGIAAFEGGDEPDDANAADHPGSETGNGGCDVTKPFGAPELMFVETDRVFRDAWLTPDERTIYFSTASQTGALHVAQRKERTDTFVYANALRLNGGVNSPSGATQYAPNLTADELHIFYQYDDRPTDPLVRIRTSGRSSSTGDFTLAFEVIGLPDAATATPALNADASRLYFAVASPTYHLSYAPTLQEGYVGATSALGELNGPGERYPTPSADERTLYFMRAPVDGGTDNDIWIAQRADAGGPFSGADIVTELQTPYSEAPNWLSPDGCRLYFSSDRPLADGGGAGYLRIWRATRGG